MNKDMMRKHYETVPKETLINILIASREQLQKERDMYKTSFETMSKNYFKLENIIKEVREYVEDNEEFIEYLNILKILDKGEIDVRTTNKTIL